MSDAPRRVLVTVGSNTPFDRLLRAMQAWATDHPGTVVQAQVGDTRLTPQALSPLRCAARWSEAVYRRQLAAAELVVAHAGMGTVLSAWEAGRPLVVLPRRAVLRETRNDHQWGTARVLRQRPGIWVADTEAELPQAMARAWAAVQSGARAAPDPGFPARSEAGGGEPAAGAPPPLLRHLRSLLAARGLSGR